MEAHAIINPYCDCSEVAAEHSQINGGSPKPQAKDTQLDLCSSSSSDSKQTSHELQRPPKYFMKPLL